MNWPLRTKIRILVAALMLAIGVVVVSAFFLLADREVRDRIDQDAKAASNTMATFFREKTANLTAQTKLLADLPQLKSVTFSADEATVRERESYYLKFLRADGMAIHDANGKPKGSVGIVPEGVANEGIRQALQGKSWSAVVSADEHLLLVVCVPMQLAGYVKGCVTASSLIDDSTASQLATTLATNVVFLRRWRPMAASLQIPEALSLDSESVRVGGRDLVSQYSQLPGTKPEQRIGFLVLRDTSDIVGAKRNFVLAFVSVLITSLVVALLFAGKFASGITKPLETVVDAARVLQTGDWPEPVEVTRRDEIGLLQSVFNETTASLRAIRERLLSMVNIDPLTELQNHRRFKECLENEVSRRNSSGHPLSVLLLDVDGFAQYNHENGHAAGDQILKSVTDCIHETIPDLYEAARFGGDEFAVLLPGLGLDETEALSERLCTKVHQMTGLTASAGCAQVSHGTDNAEALILACELAVSRAEQLGGNQTCRFTNLAGGDGADPFQLQKFLKDASFATIQALAAAVDAKDPYTQGHSQRVAEYASWLAESLGWARPELDLLYRTATLHDVGKIGVPDEILKKPGRLTEEERAVMETHPVLGEVIVRKAPQLEATLPGVRHHHERWDGKGYPDGLAGEGIPLIARVLALADTFDAMTSDRPYRTGIPVDTALEEISRSAGSQFDPSIADPFCEIIRERLFEAAA